MKRILLICGLLLILAMSSGCWVYGEGKTYGIITTIENGGIMAGNLFDWQTVWVRTDATSSQTDCYVIQKSHTQLAQDLQILAMSKARAEITYNRHFFTVGCSSDEITAVTEIGGQNEAVQ